MDAMLSLIYKINYLLVPTSVYVVQDSANIIPIINNLKKVIVENSFTYRHNVSWVDNIY